MTLGIDGFDHDFIIHDISHSLTIHYNELEG